MHTPTPHRSRWFAPRPGGWDLAYLGWGVRFHGLYPGTFKRNDNWSFQLVRSGNPTLHLGSETLSTSAGDFYLLGEGIHHRWIDKGDRRSEFLVWIWKSPPRCAACTPPPAGYLFWKVAAKTVRQLQHIHARCRDEVANPDEYTPLALERLRLELELCLARLKRSSSPVSPAANRLDLAIRWMQQNLPVHRPVASLCDYLQVSEHTLKHLFLDNVGELPSNYFLRLKMEQANEMLKQGSMSVKEIAYTLGYRHANDFTRAFKTLRGKTPETVRGVSMPKP